MSELLLAYLQSGFADHGIGCERRSGVIHATDGLTVEPRVSRREDVRGTAQVRVDFAIDSPLLAGVPLVDSFAGVGNTPDEAERNAAGKFLQGSFHVVAAALTSHDGDGGQVEWEDRSAGNNAWRVCNGPVLTVASREGARIEGSAEFFPRLNTLFIENMTSGPHWMRVFLGALDGKHMGSEVLVDGAVWAPGQQLLDEHTWVYPAGYASLRYLLIALPRTA
ncbi:MAG: DUF6348 family protein [Pseudomonadota bacterium]